MKPSAPVFSLFLGLACLDAIFPATNKTTIPSPQYEKSRIQAAILLDVSGSMDGLIEQAKAQLWNMVSVMGKAKCDGATPAIEIALYEYGRTTNDKNAGYIRQISAFTSDMDMLSQELFKLRTNGGDEYCGHVIYTSLQELKWDENPNSYKVIFIAGNEDFLQGNVTYTRACEKARKKGVTVNTIYCGNREQGIREHWNLAGECGTGSFSNIDHNAAVQEIPTPYDSTLYVLNYKLNNTYIGYGANGQANVQRQAEVDQLSFNQNKSAMAQRTVVKGKAVTYTNASWDLLDAVKSDEKILEKIDTKTLPDSLQVLTKNELKKVVEEKSKERSEIQKQILSINSQREKYIAEEKAKAAGKQVATLESEIEKTIRTQAKRFNMIIQ